MFGRIKSQYLKALMRAPHGTLAFRFYLLIVYCTILNNKAFGNFTNPIVGSTKKYSNRGHIMPRFTEKSLVEDYLTEKLPENGWSFIPASNLDFLKFAVPVKFKQDWVRQHVSIS